MTLIKFNTVALSPYIVGVYDGETCITEFYDDEFRSNIEKRKKYGNCDVISIDIFNENTLNVNVAI